MLVVQGTKYEINSMLISNAERRLKNEEVGIKYQVRGTKYGDKEMLRDYSTELARFISILYR